MYDQREVLTSIRQLNDRPNEIFSRRSAPRYERTNGETTPPCNPGAGTAFGENVDFSAETWFQLAFAKTQRMVLRPTAGKEKNYQHGSKRKRRRYVPADWVYYIQSAYPFQ